MIFTTSCSLDSGQPAPPIREIASVRDAVTGERLFSGSSLQPTDLVGSYGRIFESPYFKGKYIKIYHQQAVSGGYDSHALPDREKRLPGFENL